MKKCKKILHTLSFCFILITFAVPAHPALATTGTVYVDINNGSASPAGLGDNWGTGHAYLYLQDAIDRATTLLGLPGHPDDIEIWVADGTYYPDEGSGLTNDDRDLSFTLNNHVQVLGGFLGTGATRDPMTYVTILSGDIDSDGWDNGDSFHVVTAGSTTDATAILDGCTVTYGYANGSVSLQHSGGGILIDQGAPKIYSVGRVPGLRFGREWQRYRGHRRPGLGDHGVGGVSVSIGGPKIAGAKRILRILHRNVLRTAVSLG